MLSFLFWLFVVPAAGLSLISVWSGRRFQEYVEAELRGEPEEEDGPRRDFPPAVTLIVPVRGVDHDLAGNLRSLAAQDYPDFELIVVSRSESDPAPRAARMCLGDRFRLVVSGEPPRGTGEKIHNLLAAIERARPRSDVFVFADSDGQVSPGWLRNLVAPLADESLGATTGFRWHFPEEGGFWPLLRSVWDSTIVGTMREGGGNFAWGGATAIRRSMFEKSRVAEFWRGTVSDDLRLTAALNACGLGVRFVPGAMAATGGTCGWKDFLRWAKRQLILMKVYRKRIWLLGFVAHAIYCGAMALSLAVGLTGNPLGAAGFVVAVLPGMAKGGARGYFARLMFPDREAWLDRYGWIYFWLTPIATWVWLYAFLASALTRRIEWRGYVYELTGRETTELLSAPPRG